MEETSTLKINMKEIKNILCRHYLLIDYTKNKELYDLIEFRSKIFEESKEIVKGVEYTLKKRSMID